MVSFWDRLFNRVHKCRYYRTVLEVYRTVASNCKIYEKDGKWYTSYPSLYDTQELISGVNSKLYSFCIATVKQRFMRPYDDYMPKEVRDFIWMLEDNPNAVKYYGLNFDET